MPTDSSASDPRKEKRRTISWNFKKRNVSALHPQQPKVKFSEERRESKKVPYVREPIFSANPSPLPGWDQLLWNAHLPLNADFFFFLKHKHKPHLQIIISTAGSLPAAFSCMNKHNHSLLSQQIHIRCLLKWERGSGIASCLRAKKCKRLVWQRHKRKERRFHPPPSFF